MIFIYVYLICNIYKLNRYVQPIATKNYRLKILVKMNAFSVFTFDLGYGNL